MLDRAFLEGEVTRVAAGLVGATLVVGDCAGVIVETEAYRQDDAASHSFRGPTPRAAVMFGPPGRLYVYRSYGIHWCVNVVTGPRGSGEAVLLRALRPVAGLDLMRQRRGPVRDRDLCAGPGRLCQALGVDASFNGAALGHGRVDILPREAHPDVVRDRRIGIRRDAERPWRFLEAGSAWVSRPPSAHATAEREQG
ncbi:MAG: DNA-3-methyladenine glycosylase [Thermoleophilia bacterium]|nr:DNA-3-methyladenine glycosylase [Thermoleophilia bacterium]